MKQGKKILWQRFVALLLAIALLVSGIQFGTDVSKAEEATSTEYTSMKITGFGNTDLRYGHWRFYVPTSATTPEVEGGGLYYVYGLEIDTSLVHSVTEVLCVSGASQLLIMIQDSGTTAEAGDYVIVRAGKATKADNSVGIELTQDCKLVYDGTNWNFVPNYIDVTLNGVNNVWYQDGTLRISFSTDVALPASGVYSGIGNHITFSTPSSSAYGYSPGGNDFWIIIEGWTEEAYNAIAEGTYVTLNACDLTVKNDSTIGIHLLNNFSMTYESGEWKTEITEEFPTIEATLKVNYRCEKDGESLENILGVSSYTNDAAGDVLPYVSGETTLSPVEGKGGVYLNNKLVDVSLVKATTDYYYIDFATAGIELDATDVVVIQGLFRSNNEGLDENQKSKQKINFAPTAFTYEGVHAETANHYWSGAESGIAIITETELTQEVHFRSVSGHAEASLGGLNINISDTDPIAANAWKWDISAYAGQGAIYFNGKKMEGATKLTKLQAGRYYLAVSDMYKEEIPLDSVGSYTITLKGLFGQTDSSGNVTYVYFNEQTFEYDANINGWKICYDVDSTIHPTPYKDGHATELQLLMSNTEISADAMSATGYTKLPIVSGGVYKNGVLTSWGISKIIWNRYAAFPSGIAVGDIVTIDAKVHGTTDAGDSYTTYIENCSYKYLGEVADGNKWEKVPSFKVEKLHTMTTGEEIHLETSFEVEGTADETTYTGVKYAINDVEQDATLSLLKTSYGTVMFTMPECEQEEYTLTLKMGTYDGLYLWEDFTLYVNQYGVSDKAYITGESGALALDTSSVSTAKAIYLTGADTVPVNATGYLLAEDAIDNGLFLNAVKIAETSQEKVSGSEVHTNGYLQKYADGKYVINLQQPAVAGDIITVCGQFNYKEQAVCFDTLDLKFDGGNWTTVTDDAIVVNSLNANLGEEAGFLIEGNATVEGQEVNDGKQVIYKAGSYDVVYNLGGKSYSREINLFHVGDANTDNKKNILDLIVAKKRTQGVKELTAAGEAALAALNVSDVAAGIRKKLISDVSTMVDDVIPSAMKGITGAGTYITQVESSENGSTVISVADTENNYSVNADQYDDYGLDYVLDFEANREIKILQLTDTQTMDSTNMSSVDCIADATKRSWYFPENRDAMLYDYIRETIDETKPDLILVTGDLIYGEYDSVGVDAYGEANEANRAGELFSELITILESQKIPWAPVFGDHDHESSAGVLWQSEELQDATYCLFNRRHNVNGNGNYSIGLAHNGTVNRVVYMMDTNACVDGADVDTEGSDLSAEYNGDVQGFTEKQLNWYRTMALRVNQVAQTIVPSSIACHIPPQEVLNAVHVAGYQIEGEARKEYTVNESNAVTTGDNGLVYKNGFLSNYPGNQFTSQKLLRYMNECGTDSTYFGHLHHIGLSVYYGKVNWTFGLKTGNYDYQSLRGTQESGGTLITMSADGKTSTTSRVNVTPQVLEMNAPAAPETLGIDFTSETYYTVSKAYVSAPETYEAWVYLPETVSTQGGVILSNREFNTACISFEINLNGSPRLYYKDSDKTEHNFDFTGVDVRTGDWTHLAIVHDTQNAEVRCYLNGQLAGTKTGATAFDADAISKAFAVGRDGVANYFKGRIREIALYTDVRTEAEILADMYGINVNDESLLAYYELPIENKENNIADASVNSYDVEYLQNIRWLDSKEEVKDYAYSFAVVGDTQKMTKYHPDSLKTLYKWIADNKSSKNIQYVFGLGDIIDTWGSETEWAAAKEAIDQMNGIVPYSLIRGNHDDNDGFNSTFNNDTYKQAFSAGNTDYGFYDAEKLENAYTTFKAGDVNYLLITLDYGATEDVLAWASAIVEQRSEYKTIVTTHGYLYQDGTTLDANESTTQPDDVPGGQNGDAVWEKFVSKHENIILVLSGHIGSERIIYTQREGDKGNLVTEMLINPQTLDDYGCTEAPVGLVAMFYVSEDGKTISVEYYSTIKNKYFMSVNQFEFSIVK